MNNFTDISNAIVILLQGIQQESQPAFASVFPFPSLQGTGWPIANVVPSSNLSAYESVAEDLRTYIFDIDLYYSIQQNTNGGYQTAFAVMQVLVDTVLDALDNSNDLGLGQVQIMLPTPSVWGMVQTSAATVLTAKITVSCKVLVPQNNG
jgi:hypothetical protein